MFPLCPYQLLLTSQELESTHCGIFLGLLVIMPINLNILILQLEKWNDLHVYWCLIIKDEELAYRNHIVLTAMKHLQKNTINPATKESLVNILDWKACNCIFGSQCNKHEKLVTEKEQTVWMTQDTHCEARCRVRAWLRVGMRHGPTHYTLGVWSVHALEFHIFLTWA